jgi:hypothetical protein
MFEVEGTGNTQILSLICLKSRKNGARKAKKETVKATQKVRLRDRIQASVRIFSFLFCFVLVVLGVELRASHC